MAFYHKRQFPFWIAFLIIHSSEAILAQDCSCTIQEVQNNSVESCTYTIGNTITVNTAQAFRNAINQANANGGNMTILIEDGVYAIASSTSYPYITANNLVIRSASGNRNNVVLHGGGMTDVDPATENALHVDGDNVVIADLTIRDVGNHGIQVGGHNLFVHNVRIQNTYQQMLKGATNASTIMQGTVQCSLFEYTAGVGPNYYIGGLDIHKGHDWIVRDNVFLNIISPGGSVAEHAIHFWNNSANNIIERNLIINCDRGIGFGLGSSPNTGGIIRNNMIYHDGSGSFDDVGIGLETSPDTKVYNNTIYIQYQNAIEYRFEETTDVEITNNLTNRLIRSRDGGEAELMTNITNAQPEWFNDLNAGDLHLSFAIPDVVDQGIDLSGIVDEDFDQTVRPHGAGYDIGAHELFSTGVINLANNDFTIFPNPGTGRFYIRNDASSAPIQIYGPLGNLVVTVTDSGISAVDISAQPPGLYLVLSGGIVIGRYVKR